MNTTSEKIAAILILFQSLQTGTAKKEITIFCDHSYSSDTEDVSEEFTAKVTSVENICFKENPELTMAEVICEYSNDIGNETIVITLIHRRANDLFEQGIQVMSHTGERIFCGQIQTISYCESLNF